MRRKYDIIHDNLQLKIDRGEITLEKAKEVDRLAYEKYGEELYIESKDEYADKIEAIKDAVADGKIKLDAEQKKFIDELYETIEEDDSDDSDDSEDDEE